MTGDANISRASTGARSPVGVADGEACSDMLLGSEGGLAKEEACGGGVY